MKRNKTQIKWLKTVFVISLFSLGLLQTPISVSGDWSEDFSDISDWLLKAYDVLTWEENGPFPEGTHHWQQVDGKLYSEGSPVAQNTADIACHNATIEEGYWTIEATGQFHIYLVDAWDPDSITRKDTGISVNLEWSTGSKLFANLVVIYSKDGYINAYQSAREITPQDVYKVKIAFDDTLVAVYINDELTLSQNTQFIRTKIPDDICLWGGWPGSPVT